MSNSISRWSSKQSGLKISRNDDQIFALNYENLYDNDYLSRLFTSDGNAEQEQSHLDAWALAADLPEDMQIFGGNAELANSVLVHRMLNDEPTLPKSSEGQSEAIYRQIFIFDKISKLVILKCERTSSTSTYLTHLTPNLSPRTQPLPLLSQALSSALRVVEKNIDNGLSMSALNSLISLLHQFFKYSVSANVEPSARLSYSHVHMLRCVLCNGARHGISHSSEESSSLLESVQSLQLALASAYGILIIGLNTGSVGDILLGMSHILAISLFAEEKQIELDDSLSSSDAELNLQEKVRMKVKMQEMRGVAGSRQHHPQSSVPEGDDDIPHRELGGYEVKVHGLKTKPPTPQQPRGVQPAAKQGVTDKKLSLQIVKGSHQPSTRPGLGGQHFDGDAGVLDAVTGGGPNNHYSVTSWRLSTDPTIKRNHPSPSSKCGAIVNTPMTLSGEENSIQVTYRAKSGLQHLQQVPRNVLDNVFLNFSSNRALIGDASPSSNMITSRTTPAQSEVWSCGQNSYGELGHGDVNLRRSFTKVTYFDSRDISCIGAGNEHSLFVSQQGKTYVCGYNDNGQCGMGTNQQVRQPSLVPFLEGEDVTGVFVFNGCEHTLVLTRDGKLFSFGYNYRGQLGLGSTSSEPIPRPIKGVMSRKVVKAACSYHHTVVVCSDFTVFSFGRNDCGQLGHGDMVDKKHPHMVSGLDSVTPVSVSCGQFHTVLVTSEGGVLVCGKNDYGQLGLDGSENVKTFSRISCSLHNMDSIVQACCGYYHTIALSRNGLVYGFGRNDYGQLGLGHAQPRMYGVHVNNYLRDKNVTSLAAGCYHSIAVTSNGMLYVYGRNNHGQLGTSDVEERHTPHPVDDFVGKKIVQIAAGFYHTIVLTSKLKETNEPISSCDSADSCGGRISQPLPQSSVDSADEDEHPANADVDRELSDDQQGNTGPSNIRHITLRDLQNSSHTVCLRELFMFLTTNLEDSSTNFHVCLTAMKQDESAAQLRSIALQLRTASMMLQINRQCVNGSLCIDMPFSQEETFSIIATVLRIADTLLQTTGTLRCLNHHEEDGKDATREQSVNYSDLLLHQNPTAFCLHSANDVIERIASLHTSKSEKQSSIGADHVKSATVSLQESLFEMRLELLFVYFFLQEPSCEKSSRVLQMTSTCLSSHFEVLFLSISSRCNFISFLAECLTDMSTFGDDYFDATMNTLVSDGIGDTVDYTRCLRLFTQFCSKYRSVDEVISLFRTSTHKGLMMYKYVLDVYANVSKHQLEQRLRNSRDQPYDSLRALSTLEQCCAHFTKCSIPVIFANALETYRSLNSEDEEEIFTLGCTIINSLFSAAETILDIIRHNSVTEDARDTLRNGTILCSILPTFMLYALSNIRLCDSRFSITGVTHRFMIKLQEFVVSVDGDKGLQSSMSSKRTKDEDSVMLPGPSKVGDSNIGGKRETANSFWWNRLLKLTVVLCSKLSSSSLVKIADVSDDDDESGAVTNTFDQHEIWKYCFCMSSDDFKNDLPGIESDNCRASLTGVIEVLRAKESKANSTYRTVLAASKVSKINHIIIRMENAIADSILSLDMHFNDSEFASLEARLHMVWKSVASLIVSIVRKRTDMMSRSDGISWVGMTETVLQVMNSTNKLLARCAPRCGVSSLPCPRPSQSLPRAAFRRAVLVVMCLNRWKKCTYRRWSQQSAAVVSFYANVLQATVFSLPLISERHVEDQWKRITKCLSRAVNLHSRQTTGILSAADLLGRMGHHPSIQIDLLSILATAWKGNAHTFSGTRCLFSRSSSTQDFCCTLQLYNHRAVAINGLLDVIQKSIVNFCVSFCQSQGTVCSTQDITLFCANVKFLRLFLVDCKGVGCHSRVISTLSFLKSAVVAIDSKLVDLQTVDDKSSGGASKRASSRERAAYFRRAASVIVNFMEMLSSAVLSSSDYDTSYNAVLDANCDLLVQLRRSSEIVASSENSGFGFPSDSSRDLFSKNGKDVNSHRRRCQELIVNPMQFSRNQEGFVVQGEKLLSNFKGIDFTLAFWVYISKKSGSRYNFLLGKVSHNDAWPLIGVRGSDMKVEVLFGRANEFERLTGQTSIPTGAWVHLAVVIDPRKVRLFVNGIMDSQMTTAGNARAILYPVIIGSCPSGVRTRVDYIKEGFDGLVASLKYYTRALSPIHVRVIYDQGPPEAHDARERLTYLTLASCMTLASSIEKHESVGNCSKLLSALHGIFLSRSSRLRYGALAVMSKILVLNVVDDMILAKCCKTNSQVSDGDEVSDGTSIMTVSCLPEYSSFHERFVLYAIRLVGLCWCPSMIQNSPRESLPRPEYEGSGDDNDTNTHEERLKCFLRYCPTFVGATLAEAGSSFNGDSSTSGGVVEVPVAREDLLGELCQNMLFLLRQLSGVPRWNTALATVVYRCICKCKVTVESRSGWTDLVMSDVLGAVAFLGGLPAKPVIGSSVKCMYCSQDATVLNIDKATNHATVLTKNSTGAKFQLMTVKTSELSGIDEPIAVSFPGFVSHSILDLMDALGGYVHILMTDLMSVYRPDHTLMRQHLLPVCRPIEIFIYHQLIRRICESDISMADICTRSSLFTTILSNSIRAIHNDGIESRDTTYSIDNERQISYLWIKSSPYITRIPNKIIEKDFPSAEAETCFSDFANRNLGISLGSFQSDHGTLIRYGLLSELVNSIACEELSDEHTISVNSLSERFCNDSFCEVPLEDDGVEHAVSYTLRLLYQLRASIVSHSRKLFRDLGVDETTFGSLKLPWKVMLWQQMAYERECKFSVGMGEIVDRFTAHMALSHRVDITHCLVSSLRYSATSLMQQHGVRPAKGTKSVGESTDLIHRILQATFQWLRVHQNSADEINLCHNILKVLLPSIFCIDSSEIELHVTTICTLAVHRILIRILGGATPPPDLVDFVSGGVFSKLWSQAQEHIVQERGHAQHNMTTFTQNIVFLASGFSVIQRNLERSDGDRCLGDNKAPGNAHSMTPRTPRVRSVSESIPEPPKVLNKKWFSVEIDVSVGLSLGDNVHGTKAVYVEVALRVLSENLTRDNDTAVYETIYYGSCGRFVHTGLCSSSMYSVRCRTIVDSMTSMWSAPSEFRTEASVSPFVFDPLKCGADIIVSQDGRTVSYTGDDNWSSVLGNNPFTNGVNSWEIKISSSSTAYIFVGVATSSADLNTFLGGCAHGWGFIGEQALYHGREKVKIYGEPFSAGDVVGVILDFNSGTLSFTRNGKSLGIAFDKIFGELYPAVAFYNVGQEVEIVSDSARTLCPPVPLPCSPSILNMDQISLIHEMLYSITTRSPFSPRVLEIIAEHLTSWTSGTVVRMKAISGSQVFISKKSTLLRQYGFVVGDRIRSQYGIAEIVGTAYGRIWFQTKENSGVWYFSKQQVTSGRSKGLFQRCSYDAQLNMEPWDESADRQIVFDAYTLHELLDPLRWSEEIDEALVKFLLKTCSKFQSNEGPPLSPWDVSCEEVCDDFRSIQQQLSRLVIGSVELSHKWGVTGPKRKAVLARIGMLRCLNHLLENTLPVFLPAISPLVAECQSRKFSDEHIPPSISLGNAKSITCPKHSESSKHLTNSDRQYGDVLWPSYRLSWKPLCQESLHSKHPALLAPAARRYVFPDLKNKHFWRILSASVAKVSKTDDDYDYPDDLPLVKLNRFKSFRAIEMSQLMDIPGDDLFYSTLFSQLWKELRQHPDEKLKISYTHPMDDGQSRTFKVRFEGEGVDDYGGPYREVFQKICEELQTQDPAAVNGSRQLGAKTTESILSGERNPLPCFIPLLLPTANWTAGQDCVERYRYTFHPASTSASLLDLFLFLGQVVGIALRSRITLDLPLASFIWKSVVRDTLTDGDIASFDVAACSYVQYLGSICHRLSAAMDSDEALGSIRDEAASVLQDVTWTVTYSDGRVVELIPGGTGKNVDVSDLSEYLRLYVESRLNENAMAVEAFRKGILCVVPESALALLTWEELELLVCGSRTIDVERLKANTEYDDDVSPTDAHIINFWEVLTEFSENEKAAFLRFVWARPTLPPKDVEFPQKLKIQSAVGDDASSKPDSYLPKAHTCFFSVNLPRYSSKMVMAEKLRYAVIHCTEMDADFRVTEPDVVGWSTTTSAPGMSNYADAE